MTYFKNIGMAILPDCLSDDQRFRGRCYRYDFVLLEQNQTAAQNKQKKTYLYFLLLFLSVSSLLNSLNVKNTLSLFLYTFDPPYFHSCPRTCDPESHLRLGKTARAIRPWWSPSLPSWPPTPRRGPPSRLQR